MARTVAELPPGARITDYISLGVITKTFPLSSIGPVLSNTGESSIRQRDLPAQVVVYYVIALALYMRSSYREVLRCLLEAVQWLRDPSLGVRVAGKSGISQACTRLGWEPLRQLHDELVKPVAVRSTRGAQRYSPLGRGRPFIRQFSMRSLRNAPSQAATGAIPAASSAR